MKPTSGYSNARLPAVAERMHAPERPSVADMWLRRQQVPPPTSQVAANIEPTRGIGKNHTEFSASTADWRAHYLRK